LGSKKSRTAYQITEILELKLSSEKTGKAIAEERLRVTGGWVPTKNN